MKTIEQQLDKWKPCKDYYSGRRQETHVIVDQYFMGLYLQKGCVNCLHSLRGIKEDKQKYLIK